MRTMNLIMALSLTLGIGCRSIAKKDMVVGASKLSAETQQVWHRPNEVTYEFLDYCEAASSTSRFLGIWPRTAGDPVPGGLTLPTFGATAGLGANGKWAVARAVDGKSADGMYILRIEDEKNVVFPIWTTRTKVRGKCLRLKDLGMLNSERADQNRNGHPMKADKIEFLLD